MAYSCGNASGARNEKLSGTTTQSRQVPLQVPILSQFKMKLMKLISNMKGISNRQFEQDEEL
jgi:hypothetical protein